MLSLLLLLLLLLRPGPRRGPRPREARLALLVIVEMLHVVCVSDSSAWSVACCRWDRHGTWPNEDMTNCNGRNCTSPVRPRVCFVYIYLFIRRLPSYLYVYTSC